MNHEAGNTNLSQLEKLSNMADIGNICYFIKFNVLRVKQRIQKTGRRNGKIIWDKY